MIIESLITYALNQKALRVDGKRTLGPIVPADGTLAHTEMVRHRDRAELPGWTAIKLGHFARAGGWSPRTQHTATAHSQPAHPRTWMHTSRQRDCRKECPLSSRGPSIASQYETSSRRQVSLRRCLPLLLALPNTCSWAVFVHLVDRRRPVLVSFKRPPCGP